MKRPLTTGFSFIELMASLAIMAVLLLVAVPAARMATLRHQGGGLDLLVTVGREIVEEGRADLVQAGHGSSRTRLERPGEAACI